MSEELFVFSRFPEHAWNATRLILENPIFNLYEKLSELQLELIIRTCPVRSEDMDEEDYPTDVDIWLYWEGFDPGRNNDIS